jgi:hypothetical protein
MIFVKLVYKAKVPSRYHQVKINVTLLFLEIDSSCCPRVGHDGLREVFPRKTGCSRSGLNGHRSNLGSLATRANSVAALAAFQ